MIDTTEFDVWFKNLGDNRINGQYPCIICKYNGECYCPAANWMEPELNLLKCRESLWETISDNHISFTESNWQRVTDSL